MSIREDVVTGLTLTRLPGEFGPVLRCTGELNQETALQLRREVEWLAGIGHAAIVVNLTGCRVPDPHSVAAIGPLFRCLREHGKCPVLVAAPAAGGLYAAGLDWRVRVYPTEEAAALALRGGMPSAPGPATLRQARDETIARWKTLLETLEQQSPEEVQRELTSLVPLCEYAEDLLRECATTSTTRCEFCPLFYFEGSEPLDIGCQRTLTPILEAVGRKDYCWARTRLQELIAALERIPTAGGPGS